MTPAELLPRKGQRPAVHKGLPQHQTEQHSDAENWATARNMVEAWQDAVIEL